MDAVILFSHGSLLCGAGEALSAHATRLRERGIAPIIAVGYLNYTEPLFAETVAACVAQGAERIIVTPYFLAPGYFVKTSLPKAVAAAQEAYPQQTFVIAESIGYDAGLAEALIASAKTAAPPEVWREDRKRAAAFCRAFPQCPLFEGPDCPVANPLAEEQARSLSSASFPSVPSSLPPQSALLVMVHGSPTPGANEDMFRVTKVIRQRGIFSIVEAGFMECNEPTIPDAIDACVAQGAAHILAVPYFLHTGNHVADDLPALLDEGRARYPAVTFRMGAYLGRSERLTDILAERTLAVMK